MIRFTVPGEPKGKGRPRVRIIRRRGAPLPQLYTPPETVEAEAWILESWRRAGGVVLPEAAGLEVGVRLVFERPESHLLKSGGLSAEGRRHPFPLRTKPDADNGLKLVMDALNGEGWEDDVRVVRAVVTKAWGLEARTEVVAQAAAVQDVDELLLGREL